MKLGQRMREPTFDRDGYPTDETLDTIEHWDVIPTIDGEPQFDWEAAMDFVGRAWSYPEYWKKEEVEEYGRTCTQYTFSTGGWSGNESLVAAMEANTMLSMLGPYSWQRGGHYVYRFPPKPEEK